MPKIVWSLSNETTSTDYTSSMMSFTYFYGRRSYLDNYQGHDIAITIKNNSNQSAGFAVNDRIAVIATVGIYQATYQSYWVSEIQYNDYPGNTGLSTATIIASDAINRLGRSLGNSVVIASGTTGQQLVDMAASASWPGNITVQNNSTVSVASAVTITDSYANQINLDATTEKGVLFWAYGKSVRLIGRSYVNNLRGSPTFSLSKTASTTAIAYQGFRRIAAGLNLVNYATVTPAGLTSVVGSNSSSISLYGQNGITQSTVDSTTTQAQGGADWIAQSQSSPTNLRFEVDWLDLAQDQTALLGFLQNVTGFGLYPYIIVPLTYRVPGAVSDTTVETLVEGWTVRANPESTQYTFYLSPLTYYQFFTLDSSTLGILDTSRLGW